MSKKIIYSLVVCIIIVISFFTLSPNYHPEFNSDGAVIVLMTYYFNVPHDLYFWGQDRAGSLIPAFAQIFFRFLNFRPVTSVSLSYYFFLVLGFLSFSQLFKTYFSKIVFCIAWFLPFFLFSDLIWYTIGLQYCLIGILIFILSKIREPISKRIHRNNLLLILLVSIIFLITFWVSDLSIISILVLVIIFSLFELWKYASKTKIIYISSLTISMILSFGVIHFLKRYCTVKTSQYESINTFNEMLNSLKIICKSIYNYLSFNSNDLMLSICIYCIFIILLYFGYWTIKRKFSIDKYIFKWLIFLLCDLILILSVLISSHWVYLNEMGRRYFISTYISCSIIILLLVEHLTINKKDLKRLKLFIVLTVVICALSNEYHFKFVSPQTTKPIIKIVSEFKELGNIGLIAEYWNAYVSSASDPKYIKATPHDKDAVRNFKLVDEVFLQPNIYVIRDQWMEYFPDTLIQFNHVLLKNGNQISIANCMICKYTILK